ncbi:hypothetical protein H9638_14925 [Arthrobacter sp. Sa2BUA2]|uniref:Uncharacterized protein n=1 Tax=Arthrobacter pullicola TaxID=2762224 RepID=A0ABR8YLI9_9MICC|nr:hypothetical protein [Arthrobacter pullicola]MBD8045104.1 hypothetical protein [Arthrobacter pullicola]
MSEQVPPANNYSYNAYSSNQAPSAPPAPVRPQQVDLGFWLLIAAAVLSVISIPVGMAWLNSSGYKESMVGAGISAEQLDALIAATVVTTLFFAVISVAISVLVALFIRKGHNWARIVATVFAALSLFNLTGLAAGGLMAITTGLGVLLPVTAVVLLWMKPATEYFQAAKAYRQYKNYNPGA